MTKAFTPLLIALFILVMLTMPGAAPAAAADAKKFGTYGDWDAYTYMEDGAKVCYIASSPVTAKGDYKKRGNIFAMVTHRTAEKSVNVFSYLAGYDYRKGDQVTVAIDGQAYSLYGDGAVAWTANEAADQKLVAALRKGKTMVIRGRSSNNTETSDSFSLKGTGSALDAITKECK